MVRVRTSLTFILGCALLSGGVLYVGCGSDEEAVEPVLEPEYEDSAPPDLCEPISGEVCSTFPQCGCAPKENCNVVAASGRTACVPTGSGALHATCVNVGECAVGLQCLGGVCVPLCLEDPDCTLTGARCKRVTFMPAPEEDAGPPGEDAGPPETGGDAATDAPQPDTRLRGIEIPGYSVCLAQCDPLNPAAVCGAGHSCVFFAPGDDTTQCITPGTATGVGGCKQSSLACASGYGCFDGDCRKICRVGMAGDCTMGTCAAFPEPLTKGGVQYGTCK